MSAKNLALLLILFFSCPLGARGAVISVPFDYSTIQDAINSAVSGDEVIVEPGVYVEKINFLGKEIHLRSRHGAAVTIIDGNRAGTVVGFRNGEGPGAILEGFTIKNGHNTYGGGITCRNASPVIRKNIVTGNSAMDGGGILCWRGSPLLDGNEVSGNTAWKGGGILCTDNASPVIVNNMVTGNEVSGHGGGICCWGYSSPAVTNNTIAGNSANEDGGGFYCMIQSHPVVTNTILWNNQAPKGPEIWVGYAPHPSTLTISHCDVAGGQAAVFVARNCTLNWGAGMIDADPAFADADGLDMHVTGFSPCVDAGDNAAPSLPSEDFDGDNRIVDGTVDIGADEFFEGQTLEVDPNGTGFVTIQSAIDAAVDGDVVVVVPGSYPENIDFRGKAITLKSQTGAHSTFISGDQLNSVVTFASGEGYDSILKGFTIKNGSSLLGGGIGCRDSSPTIRSNIITENEGMDGGGIGCWTASPAILDNRISGNGSNDTGRGGGIYCYDRSYPLIVNNMILGNLVNASGGGICCWDGARATITGNTIFGNTSGADGGGVLCDILSNARIANTILWENSATAGSQIWVGNSQNPSTLAISFSDVQGGQAGAFVAGNCTLDWGQGMIDADPDFIDPGASSLHIRGGSPCADAGDNNAPGVGERDFEGDPRINNTTVDMGADELYPGQNVFIIVMDGIRADEGFDDPSHQYIPHIWNDLRPLGTIYTNFWNQGFTVTTPAHMAITSGVMSQNTNNYLAQYGEVDRIQEEPSIFQYYRSQLGVPKEKTWIINGKGTMIKNAGICQNPGYRDNYGPSVAFQKAQDDLTTLAEFKNVLDTYHPSLTLVNFKEVDAEGHLGILQNYLDAIVNADSYIYDLCQTIWQDPCYDDNTTIIILSDHGRHLDTVKDGFVSHGGSCIGCRKVLFIAIGPDVKKNAVITKADPTDHLYDIASTAAHLLGFNLRYGRGHVLGDMFVNPPPQESPSLVDPDTAWANGKLHATACRHYEGKTEILYANTTNNGKTWNDFKTLSTSSTNMKPVIAADGNRVAVAWSSFNTTDGSCKVTIRESLNGGASWPYTNIRGGDLQYHEDAFPSISYSPDLQKILTVAWTELALGSGRLHVQWFKSGQPLGFDSLKLFLLDRASCYTGTTGRHIVFQDFKPDAANWDITYIFNDGTPWPESPPYPTVAITETLGESTWPDVISDADGVHVIWCEEDDGFYRIMVRNSPDRVNWDGPYVVGESLLGAWHPRIARASDRLVVVWEGYDSESPSIFSAESTDGGVTWSAPTALTGTEKDDLFPSIAIDSQDMLHLFWMKAPAPLKMGHDHIQLK